MHRREPLIFIVSGEASGDNLAGALMGALKRATGNRIRFAGVGGPQSESQGLQSLFPVSDLSVMGLAEVLPHLPRLIRRINETAAAARTLEPDAVVTVDSPGFSLRLAHHLRGSGIPVVHYVAPQLWAWGPFRARKLKKRVDHIMALLPFEVPFFAQYGVPCTYVGHPAIDSGAERGDGTAFRKRHAISAEAPVLSVLPGSRPGEVRRMLPVFGEALTIVRTKYPNLHAVIPMVEPVTDAVRAVVSAWPVPPLLVADSERFDAFAASDAAMAKSGTVTLELALANVPMTVAYRISPASAFIVRRMGVSVEHASLVNLLVGRQAVPEFLQEECSGPKIADAMLELLRSSEARTEQQKSFREMSKILGVGASAPSERAAKVVLDIIGAKSGASKTAPSPRQER